MIKTFNFVLIWVLFAACQSQPQQGHKSLPVFDLTDPSHSDILNLSDINIKDIDYIPLETNDASLFGNIHKLIVSDSCVYIIDYQQTILKFGTDGSFINRISKQGRGPEEYGDSFDFAIDPDSQDLYICSIGDKKIYSYTNQGSFLNCFPLPESTFSIMFDNGTILCHRPNSRGDIESCLVMVDKKGNVVEKFPNVYKYKKEANTGFEFLKEIIWFRFKNNLYIKDIHSDTVFLFNNKQFIPQFILNHGGKTISPEARKQFDTDQKFLDLGAKYAVEIDVWRLGDYVISGFMYNNKLYIYASDFNGDNEHLANLRPGIFNDIDGGPNLRYHSICNYDENTMLAWVSAYKLIAHVNSDKFKNSTPKYPEKKKALEKLANSLKKNDNPVLMLVKLKE